MKKVFLFLVLSCFVGITFGQVGTDCPLSVSIIESSFANTKTFDFVYPQASLKVALQNLQAYCCTTNLLSPVLCSGKFLAEQYPESAYLYDHLVDIGIRRLDGYPGGYVYGLPPDPQAQERRTTVETLSLEEKGALDIGLLYDVYWKSHNSYDSNPSFFLSHYLDGPEVVSLSDKYDAICKIAKEVYAALDNQRSTAITSQYLAKCQKLVARRKGQEALYIKSLLIRKSGELLVSSFSAYVKDYFVGNRLPTLLDKIVNFANFLTETVKRAPASKKCSP